MMLIEHRCLAQCLQCLDIPFMMIRSAMNMDARDQAVRAINDPTNRLMVLLMTYDIGGTGLNLHGACHTGISVQLPHNVATEIQGMARIYRLGQTKMVSWFRMKTVATFAKYQEAKLCKKYVDQLEAEADIPSWIEPRPLRRMICYEYLRQLLGMSFNRFVWEKDKMHSITDYTSLTTVQRGKFYSLMSRMLMGEVGKQAALHPVEVLDDGKDLTFMERVSTYLDIAVYYYQQVDLTVDPDSITDEEYMDFLLQILRYPEAKIADIRARKAAAENQARLRKNPQAGQEDVFFYSNVGKYSFLSNMSAYAFQDDDGPKFKTVEQ